MDLTIQRCSPARWPTLDTSCGATPLSFSCGPGWISAESGRAALGSLTWRSGGGFDIIKRPGWLQLPGGAWSGGSSLDHGQQPPV